MNLQKLQAKIDSLNIESQNYQKTNNPQKELEINLKIFKLLKTAPLHNQILSEPFFYSQIKKTALLLQNEERFDEAIIYLKRAYLNKNYSSDTKEFALSLKQNIAITLIKISLINFDKKNHIDYDINLKLNESYKILKELAQVNLTGDLLKQNKLYLNIIDGLRNNTFLLHMEFNVPFPLYINTTNNISFLYNNLNCSIQLKLIKSPFSKIQSNGFVEMSKDKYGLENRTHVSIKINKFFWINNKFNDKVLLYGLDIINYFILHYRLSTKEFWIDELNKKMINDFSFEMSFNGFSQKKVISQMPNSYIISNKQNKIDINRPLLLKNSLNNLNCIIKCNKKMTHKYFLGIM